MTDLGKRDESELGDEVGLRFERIDVEPALVARWAIGLGAVSVVGPVRMDYAQAIGSVRQAAAQLSRFVGELYDE